VNKDRTLLVSKEESLDYVLSGLELIQPRKGYRFSLDAVLLAYFPKMEGVNTAVDLGTGNGIIPLLLSLRSSSAHIIGVEVQDSMVERAKRTVKYNSLENRIEIIHADIRHIKNKMPGHFAELVVSNPPFWKKGEGKICENGEEAVARHELLVDMEQIILAANYILCPGGRLCIIQRADRLPEVVELLRKYRLNPEKLKAVHAFIDREAKIFLIEARKNGRGKLTILPPFIIYDKNGEYSEEIQKIYAGGP